MYNRLLFILLFLYLGLQTCFAQENNRELGIRFNELTTFSLIYKKHLRKNTYRRHRGAVSNISLDNSPTSKIYRFTFDYSIGREVRTKIKEPFYFISGFETFIDSNYFHSTNFGNEDKSIRISSQVEFGMGLVFGLYYEFSKHLSVNLEAVPGFLKTYNIRKLNNSRPMTFSESPIEFQVSRHRLFYFTVAYRFHYESKKSKKKGNKKQ